MTDIDNEHGLAQPRWPWQAAGAVLLTAAAAAGAAVYLHWIPCRGSMFNGTVFEPRASGDLPDACLTRMDTGIPFPSPPEVAEQAPWALELGALAMGLAIAAWIVLVLGLRLRRQTRLAGLLAAVAPSVLAVMAGSAALDRQRDPDAYTSEWISLAVEVMAVVVLIAFWLRHDDLRHGLFPGMVLVLWGATAFGAVHGIADYVAMTMFNQNNWDTPPGTGWITVGVLVISGCGSIAFGGSSLATGQRPDHPLPPLRLAELMSVRSGGHDRLTDWTPLVSRRLGGGRGRPY